MIKSNLNPIKRGNVLFSLNVTFLDLGKRGGWFISGVGSRMRKLIEFLSGNWQAETFSFI